MPTSLPNYKDHLKEAIQKGHNAKVASDKREDVDEGGEVASPEASILSSYHTSTHGGDSSFLSVTPSMLNSSVFDERQESLASSSSHNNHHLDEQQEAWYDSSTFLSVGSRIFNQGLSREEDMVDAAAPPVTAQAELLSVRVEGKKNKDSSRGETTSMGAALQAGTIAAGITAILLILAGFGKEGGKKSEAKKKGKEPTQKSIDAEITKNQFLLSDW